MESRQGLELFCGRTFGSSEWQCRVKVAQFIFTTNMAEGCTWKPSYAKLCYAMSGCAIKHKKQLQYILKELFPPKPKRSCAMFISEAMLYDFSMGDPQGGQKGQLHPLVFEKKSFIFQN